MTVDPYGTKPSSAHIGPITEHTRPLVDLLWDFVLEWADQFIIWLNSCKGSKSGHNIYSTDNNTMYTANYNSQCSCHGNKHTCMTVGNSEGPNVENSVAWLTLMGSVPLNTAFGEDPNWRNMLIRVIRRLGAWKVKW